MRDMAVELEDGVEARCGRGSARWKTSISGQIDGDGVAARRRWLSKSGDDADGRRGRPAYGEIYDRGYKHYDGLRLGRRHAFWALVRYSMKRGARDQEAVDVEDRPDLALHPSRSRRRSSSGAAGIEAFFPSASVTSSTGTSISSSRSSWASSSPTIAPEMLCGDRRENVLSLYFSRAITRLDYLVAKMVATAHSDGHDRLRPVPCSSLGKTFLDDSPLTAFTDNLETWAGSRLPGRWSRSTSARSVWAIAAFTNRKGIAVAIIIGGVLMVTGGQRALRSDRLVRATCLTTSSVRSTSLEAISIWLFGVRAGHRRSEPASRIGTWSWWPACWRWRRSSPWRHVLALCGR